MSYFYQIADGRQLNNLSPNSGVPADGAVSPEAMLEYASVHLNQPGILNPGGHSQSMPSLPAAGAQGALVSSGNLPVRFYNNVIFIPMPFHTVMGRNVCLSSDKTLAVRLVEEYCNGYVFTSRPLRCGERMVIQILSVDTAFVGGLAFGMTACDPTGLNPDEMPDDSDLLLDRREYWVVNKDVCSVPEVGDELSFHLSEEGTSHKTMSKKGYHGSGKLGKSGNLTSTPRPGKGQIFRNIYFDLRKVWDLTNDKCTSNERK